MRVFFYLLLILLTCSISWLPPMTNEDAIIIMFFIMYCPSNVGSNGLPSWKVTSGNMNNGMNVPHICENSNNIAITVVFLNKKNTPINISQYPITITHCSGLRNGIQNTVSKTKGVAGDKSIVFNRPNQKNMVNKHILINTFVLTMNLTLLNLF